MELFTGQDNLTEVKVMVNFTRKQAMKAQRGSRGISLLFI
jgi:hypothetical protein